MKSLRAQLVAFWLILLAMCLALGVVMWLLYSRSSTAQVASVRRQAEQACTAIASRYAASLADPGAESPQLDLLQVLLQLVLLEAQGIEGGAWSASGGFLAYAYPTYEGSSVKSDVPRAEQAHIAELAQVAARTQRPQSDATRGAREALVVAACPLQSPQRDLVAWTMTRTPIGTLAAQRHLWLGLGALLAVLLISGVWLGAILQRGLRHVQRLESELAGDDPRPLAPTGIAELDRIVGALNGYRQRIDEARAALRQGERQRARDQRLAALGRMTGGVAHEIRNPIAAMRLKAENALAGPPARQPAALRTILEQIARLDALVQSLLAVVQPIQLQPRPVDLAAWAAERVAAIMTRAESRGVVVVVRAEPLVMSIDPLHLSRALDNLLDNAVRHASRRVDVTIERTARGALRVRVDDDGPGIAPVVAERLFEPFASGRRDGTGLGLALSREVALAHGGDLVHVALEPGTRFEMELPWRAS